MSKGEATREAIVREAFAQATRIGLEGLSLGVLAESLSLSKSGLFAHFKSKDALQRSVLEHAIDEFTRQVVVPALAKPRGRPRVVSLFHNFIAWKRGDLAREGCLFTQLAAEYDDRPPSAIRDRFVESQLDWRRTVAACVDKAIAEGQFRADLDAQQFAFELTGIAMVYGETQKLLRQPDAASLAERAFQRLLDDAAAPATGKRPRNHDEPAATGKRRTA